jgi:hypothetical protein
VLTLVLKFPTIVLGKICFHSEGEGIGEGIGIGVGVAARTTSFFFGLGNIGINKVGRKLLYLEFKN